MPNFQMSHVVFTFDVDLHRPKKARGNEKDKLPSGVEPRSNDQQTSTPDTEPRSPDKSLSPHSLLFPLGLLVIRPGFDSGRKFVFLIPSCFLRPL